MKRIFSIILVAVLLMTAAGGVMAHAEEDISAAFTDPWFLQLVCESLGKKEGDAITAQECLGIKELYALHFSGISRLDGIEYLQNLEKLDCSDSRGLCLADLSKNVKLTWIDLSWNQLEHLDVSALTELEHLDIHWNEIAALDLSANTKLEYLDCNDNQLTALDLSANTQLETLYCTRNQLPSLDVTNNQNITEFACGMNHFSSEQEIIGWDTLQLNYDQDFSTGIYPLSAEITVTQMPTKKHVSGSGDPSLKGLELTLTGADFTRSVRFNDLKLLHKHWSYMRERKNPDHIWNFYFESENEITVSYGVISEQGFDDFGGEGLVLKYAGTAKLDLNEESVLAKKAKVLKLGKAKTAFVTSTEEDNFFYSMFGNPLFQFIAPEEGEYQIVTSGVPKKRSYWIDLLHDGNDSGIVYDEDYDDYSYDCYGGKVIDDGPWMLDDVPVQTKPDPTEPYPAGAVTTEPDPMQSAAVEVSVTPNSEGDSVALDGESSDEQNSAAGYTEDAGGCDDDDFDDFEDYDDYDYDYENGDVFGVIDNEDGLTNTPPIWLKKGETIYLNPYVSPNDEVCGVFWWDIGLPKLAPPFGFKIKIESVTTEAADLQQGKKVPVHISRKQPSQMFAFTPEEDGNYTFFQAAARTTIPTPLCPTPRTTASHFSLNTTGG